METCKIKDLFRVSYGNSLELVYLKKDPDGIGFVSRTAKRNGVSARVRPIPGLAPFPGGLITVAVSGSVLETFLQPAPFYTGFHVMVLTPRADMSVEEKLYYCQCIRANRYKYSYGRQANSTLASLDIPRRGSVPGYVKTFSVRACGAKALGDIALPQGEGGNHRGEGLVPLSSLFKMVGGVPSGAVVRSAKKQGPGWIPYIRPSYRQETGIDAYVSRSRVPEEKVFPAGTLYVSTDGQGSHTFSYVAPWEFVPNSNVTALIPKKPMSLSEKIFYAQCITQNRYKFSYGRKPKGGRLGSVLLPAAPPREVTHYDIGGLLDSMMEAVERL